MMAKKLGQRLGVCAGVALALSTSPAAAENVELRFATLAPAAPTRIVREDP